MITDLLERPILVGDYVISYNNIYQVIALHNNGMVKMILIDPSKTTKAVNRSSHEMCLIDKEDVMIWKLKRGY